MKSHIQIFLVVPLMAVSLFAIATASSDEKKPMSKIEKNIEIAKVGSVPRVRAKRNISQDLSESILCSLQLIHPAPLLEV